MVVRSRDPGLKSSFLVVDFDGGRGTRLTPFVERFTEYLPKGAEASSREGVLHRESSNGAAV
jgi:hypothetical protein